jgi:hypothetical protein
MNCDPVYQNVMQNYWIEVDGIDRWVIYDRLKSLGFICQCQSGQPLCIQMTTVQEFIQYWCVMQHIRNDRTFLTNLLQKAWRLQS